MTYALALLSGGLDGTSASRFAVTLPRLDRAVRQTGMVFA